ncbi:MAG: gliding motility-associated C-terminal domain-containing protein [Bacteroidota bacterium]
MQFLLPVVALVLHYFLLPQGPALTFAHDLPASVPRSGELISLPDAFSPNQDGINDTFQADFCKLMDFSILVLDEQGDVLFSSEQPDFVWDGTDSQGTPVPEGVYTFDVKGFSPDGILIEENGSIVLVR